MPYLCIYIFIIFLYSLESVWSTGSASSSFAFVPVQHYKEHKHVQTFTDMSKHVQTCTEHVQTWKNMENNVKTFKIIITDVQKWKKACTNMHKHAQTLYAGQF